MIFTCVGRGPLYIPEPDGEGTRDTMTREHRSIENLWYDDEVRVYRFGYDATDDDLVVELALALAEVRDVDPTAVPPLARAVDTDRLDACVASLNGENPKVDGEVTFSVADCDVTVLPSQVVISAPRTGPGAETPDGAERRVE